MFGLALVPTVAGLLVSLVGSIVGRVLFALGMTVVYYRGIGVAVEWFRDQVFAGLSGLPATALQIAGVLQIGTCINIVFATFFARLTVLGLQSDYIKRLVIQ